MSQEEFNVKVAPFVGITRGIPQGAGKETGSISSGDVGGDVNKRDPFKDQSPGSAWTRYLAKLTGIAPSGTTGRAFLENRGRDLSSIASSFGYGASRDIGGQGEDYADFYKTYGSQGPSWGQIQSQARNVQSSLAKEGGNAYDAYIEQRYGTPKEQLDLTQGALNTQINQYGGGIDAVLARRQAQQQAVDPNQRWLDYAIAKGLI